jgi:renalase
MLGLDNSSHARIAVIGAGMAGLSCAKHLSQHAVHTTIFEKSQCLGGRLATRRADSGIAFDHGAQYIATRSTLFGNMVNEAIRNGAADYWRPVSLNEGFFGSDDWVVGVPVMNALVKPFARGVDVRIQNEVATVRQNDGKYYIRTQNSEAEECFDIVICTIPAPQAQVLFAFKSDIVDALEKVSIAPCWALMVTFSSPFNAGFDVWRSNLRDLAWVSRNNSKPARDSLTDCWVVHASPQWSQRHLELNPKIIAEMMIEMLPNVLGIAIPEIDYVSAHRWRYALTTVPLGEPYLSSEDGTLFIGGDWCLGGRVEYAFESGHAIAEALIHRRKG